MFPFELCISDLLRTVPRVRADMYDDIHSDSRYTLGGSIGHSRDAGREGLRGDVFPGPSFRSSNPSVSEDSHYENETPVINPFVMMLCSCFLLKEHRY